MNKAYKLCIKIGPGGLKCPCCADRAMKRRLNRKARRMGKKEARP